MINNNSGLKFSNLDGENNLISDEMKPLSLAELLAAHDHGDDEHHEHDHDFAGDDEHHEHDEHDHDFAGDDEHHEHDEHDHDFAGDDEHHEHDEHDYDFAGSDSTNTDSAPISVSANVINPPTATIDVNYYGFSEEAKNAFEYAVTIWEGWIKSDVAIEVDAYWQDLSQYGSGVLGAASPYSFKRNFTGATQENTYYAMPLANHLAGEDLNGDRAEIEAWFNSDFSKWDFGTDGKPSTGKYDFTTVVLHELGHGFGLTDFIDYNNGKGSYGNTIFESFIVNSDNQSLNTFENNSKELGKQLTSNNLFFSGANTTEANGGEQIKLYAPGKWEYGSSIAHFDEKTYTKGDAALMTPYFKGGEAIHNPGAITLGVLEDLGWDINKVDTKSPKITPTSQEDTPTAQANIIKIEESELTSYAGQDKDSILTISDNFQEIAINGNGWKKLAIDYSITEKTILEFEFQSDIRGEIQGIGFDTDDKFGSKTDKKIFFQLEGTDKLGVRDFKQDITGQGWKTYQITVGDYFSGDFNYLTFVNDHDKGDKNAASKFRNLRLYEEGQQFAPVETPTAPAPVENPVAPTVETPIAAPVENPVAPTVETPTTQPSIIQIEESKLTSYAGQDENSTFAISDNFQEIEIQGNGWKKLALDYAITDKTILEFEFQSDIKGEIQGIGFDTDDKFGSSDDKKLLFQLEGSQTAGVSDFKDNVTAQGWKTYQITVGDYFSGNVNYLTFVNDHDGGDKNAASKYRNLRLYEEGQQFAPVETPILPPLETPITPPVETPTTQPSIIQIEESKLTSYAGQDENSTFAISDNFQEIEIQGNGWKKLAFDYAITDKTILEFEFQSDIKGEIQGIGFDTDDKFGSKTDKKIFFQLEGADKLGVRDFKQDITGQGWKTYQITVGDYFSGDFNYLTFVNDHDKGDKNAASKFRNLRLYEEGQQFLPVETPILPPLETPITPPVETPTTQPSIIKIEQDKLTSYAGQDKDPIFNISDNNQEIEINGNGWKKLAIDYSITEKTILEFEFQSDIRGEIQGIGFDTDDKFGSKTDKKIFFQLEGTDKLGVRDFKQDITGQGWKTYQITVGDYFSGDFNYLTFVNDHDKGDKNAASKFRNLKLYEGDTNKLSQANTDENSDFTLTIKDSTKNFNLSSYGGTNQDRGKFQISDDKTEVNIEGNSWNKLDINNYNVTENTVLKFEFQSNEEAEIQGIGFDNDDIISGGDRSNLFQVAGTQDWGIELEDSYTIGSGWQTYEVNVGDYISGAFDYLTLANDDDISNSTAQSQFRNISLSEMG